MNNTDQYYKKLKEILDDYRKTYGDSIWDKHFPKQEKISNEIKSIQYKNEIEFITKHFFNRNDVFPKYWKSKNKSGYSFACSNEWVQGKCVKCIGQSCSSCKHREYSKLSDNIVHNHLLGKQTIGTYAIDEDNKSKFLVFDFDEENWKQEIVNLKKIVTGEGLYSYLEISKSGNGGHLWIFFDKKIDATILRTLGQYLLFMSMDLSDSFNFNSFDWMFPTQNKITKDGLGNLICLPFAGQFQTTGSYFVDDNFNKISIKEIMDNFKVNSSSINQTLIDKWKEINSLNNNEQLINEKTINIIRSNELLFPISELDKSVKRYLRKISSFYNPEFTMKERMRLSTYNTPLFINCASTKDGYLHIPRGLENDIVTKFKNSNIPFNIKSHFNSTTKLKIEDNVELYPHQKISFNDLIKNDMGILVANTGFGKTVIGAKLIAHYKVRTLILVNKNEIKQQWINSITKFLGIPEEDIATDKTCVKDINIRTIQSFDRESDISKDMKSINMIIVDECHHLASFTYESIVKNISAKYIYGLSATPKRSDGLTKILNYRMGNCVIATQQAHDIKKTLIIKESDFNIISNEKLELNHYNQQLILDNVRNEQIVNDILEYINKNKVILVIVEWVAHLDILYDMLRGKGFNLIKLCGGMNKREYTLEKEKFNIAGPKIILATGSYIGEGFDVPDIDTLFITFPFKWSEKLKQYIGRMRINEHKNELIIIDYLDKNISYYYKMFSARLLTYKTLGYEIEQKINLNQMIYSLVKDKPIIINEIINSNCIWSTFDVAKTFKEINSNLNIKKLSRKDIHCLVIDSKVVWIFNSNDMAIRIENKYLINELKLYLES